MHLWDVRQSWKMGKEDRTRKIHLVPVYCPGRARQFPRTRQAPPNPEILLQSVSISHMQVVTLRRYRWLHFPHLWGGLPPIIVGSAGEEIGIDCRVPAVEFLPWGCCRILLPSLKRSAIQRRRHFVSGSSTFSCTSLSGTVVQSAVTVFTGSRELSTKVGKEAEWNFCRHPTHARKCCLHILDVRTQIQQPCWAGTWRGAKGGSSILAWC